MATRMKPAGKAIIFLIICTFIGFGIYMVNQHADKIMPSGKQNGSIEKGMMTGGGSTDNEDCIRIGVVTWGGYAGGQYFNNGFNANDGSRFQKEYGICVQFMLMDDFSASREAWKKGAVDLMWVTFDAFPTEVAGLAEHDPVLLFQADWSRGGDAIVARQGIEQAKDLKGKRIAVAEGTPSHTFLLFVLDANGLSLDDITMVKVPSAIDAAQMFKSEQVDAAVVWSPDDEDCVTSVRGSTILTSTKKATHIIADGFYAKRSYVEANKEKLVKLTEGWLKGSAEINASDDAKRKAAKILSAGLKQPEDFCYKAIDNVRLATYGDNLNFFGLNPNYKGVKAEDLYNKMSKVYGLLNLTGGRTPNWRSVAEITLLQAVKLDPNDAEGAVSFTKATVVEEKAEAFSSKPVTITFPTGSSTLSGDSKYIIRNMFLDIANAFPQSRIRIEGNTDATGSIANNISLSLSRANSVKQYLINECGIDPNRIVVKGNGPNNPVCSENTAECFERNRRTDFQLL